MHKTQECNNIFGVLFKIPKLEFFLLFYTNNYYIKHIFIYLYFSYNCLFGVDAVVSVAAEPLFTDRWKIDAVVGASQKALGCIPGMAILTFSPLAKYVCK